MRRSKQVLQPFDLTNVIPDPSEPCPVSYNFSTKSNESEVRTHLKDRPKPSSPAKKAQNPQPNQVLLSPTKPPSTLAQSYTSPISQPKQKKAYRQKPRLLLSNQTACPAQPNPSAQSQPISTQSWIFCGCIGTSTANQAYT